MFFPRPPELRDRIVFLTDVQTVRPCSSCSDYLPADGGCAAERGIPAVWTQGGGAGQPEFDDFLSFCGSGKIS